MTDVKHFIQLVLFLSFSSSLVFAEPDKTKDSLKVLVWNVWHGTNDVDQGPEKALALIKESGADVCLLQESYDINGERPKFGPWAAKELGWQHFQGKSTHLCVLSRYPINKTFFHDAWHGVGAELDLGDHGPLHVFSIWLDYRAGVGGYLKKNPEATDAELLESETKRSGRLKEVEALLAYLKSNQLLDLSSPLLVGGDFNCPSHLDWTAETAKQKGHAFMYRRALPLPVSKAMQREKLIDSFRIVYPDPVKNHGNTWSPLFKRSKGTLSPMNRIDRLYLKTNPKTPKLVPVRALVYPEKEESEDIPTRDRQFPSDHAALLIEYQWQG